MLFWAACGCCGGTVHPPAVPPAAGRRDPTTRHRRPSRATAQNPGNLSRGQPQAGADRTLSRLQPGQEGARVGRRGGDSLPTLWPALLLAPSAASAESGGSDQRSAPPPVHGLGGGADSVRFGAARPCDPATTFGAWTLAGDDPQGLHYLEDAGPTEGQAGSQLRQPHTVRSDGRLRRRCPQGASSRANGPVSPCLGLGLPHPAPSRSSITSG